MMPASRADSYWRVLRKYRYFIYISVILFGFQLFLASCFLNLSTDSKTGPLMFDNQEHGFNATEPRSDNGVEPTLGHTRGLSMKCDLSSDKDPLSAIQRAKTQACKQEIADVACDNKNGKLYAPKLPRLCPLQGKNGGEYIGCFQDSATHRDLSGPHASFPADNTPRKCWKYCLKSGFRYAGVQYGIECWCGNSYGFHGEAQAGSCQKTCPGDASQSCGGYQTQNIYHTGLGDIPRYRVNLVESNPELLRNPARLVYVLTVTGRSLRQVKRLFKALYFANHYFYIHVDSRQDYLYRELSVLTDNYFNVRLTPWRMSTIWGGASLLQMLLRCMEDLLKMPDWNWDFFINLSESDFPIKTNEVLTSFLTTYKKYNFLKSHGRDTPRFIRKQGLEKTFHECETHMWKVGDRRLPDGIRIDGGSDWITLNRQFCHYLTFSNDELVVGLKQVYKYTLLPAESFFHTVLQNSEFCGTVVDNNLHLTNWQRKQGCKCQQKHVVDWCGCSPNDFKVHNWNKIMLMERKPIFFARKFEAIVSQNIISKLESYLFGDHSAKPGMESFWLNDYHHLDLHPPVSDAYFTMYEAFARLGTQKIRNQMCNFKPLKIRESHVYFHSDEYLGLLVLYDVMCQRDSQVYQIETYLRPQNNINMTTSSGPITRLKALVIGTDFDPKEEIFRNFGKLMGPDSVLGARHEWGDGHAFTLTMVWIDPAKVIAASFDVPVKEGPHVGHYKPNFKGPLRPGEWSVVGLIDWVAIFKIEFLIIPITHHQKQLITEKDQLLLNHGPRTFYKDNRNFADFKEVVNLDDTVVKSAAAAASENSAKLGPELHSWVDRLTSKHWTVISTCFVATARNAKSPCELLPVCQSAFWSSRSPDPKSEVGQVDPHTGKMFSPEMPLNRPHYWHEEKPVTNNQTYGWFHHEPAYYRPHEPEDPNYKIIRKPKPDLTYVAVKVPRDQTKQTWGNDSSLPSIAKQSRQYRKPVSDATFGRSAPMLGTGGNPGSKAYLGRPHSAAFHMKPQPDVMIPYWLQGKARPHSAAADDTCTTDSKKPMYLWHTNSGYLVRVVP